MQSDKLPAVDHHRPSVRRCRGLNPTQESQQTRGVVGHAVLRPGGKVELANLMFGRVTSLNEIKQAGLMRWNNRKTVNI